MNVRRQCVSTEKAILFYLPQFDCKVSETALAKIFNATALLYRVQEYIEMHHLFAGTLQSEDHGGGSICDSAKSPALEIE